MHEIYDHKFIRTFIHNKTRSHRRDTDKHFSLNQEYANDISATKTGKNKTEHIKKPVHAELETRNLHVSERKTE